MIKVLKSLVVGPLEEYAPAVADEMVRVGYTSSSASQHMAFIAHLSRWMADENLTVEDLTVELLEQFFASRREARYVNYRSLKSARPLCRVLSSAGILVASAVEPSAAQLLLDRFADFLARVKGLVPATIAGYVHWVHPLAVAATTPAGNSLQELSITDIHRFLAERCAGKSASSAQLCVTSLRSFLGFLHREGLALSVSEQAVPSAARWSQSALPQDMTAEALATLLAGCDRTTATGRRDFAVMLLLCRIGLRAGEVAGLQLGDIHWSSGEFIVTGKGNHLAKLPLPVEVGEAIVDYLRFARPAGNHSAVFLGQKAPHNPVTSSALSSAVARAAKKVGLGRTHAHRLRHTAATQMLRGGASLTEIGMVLRHQRPLTTAIYAKVDREALTGITRSWPGAS